MPEISPANTSKISQSPSQDALLVIDYHSILMPIRSTILSDPSVQLKSSHLMISLMDSDSICLRLQDITMDTLAALLEREDKLLRHNLKRLTLLS